jgi:hypothetical protein
MAVFSWRDRRIGNFILNVFGAVVVAFTLVSNLSRGTPLVILAAALLIGGLLYIVWVRSSEPPGIRNAASEAELSS